MNKSNAEMMLIFLTDMLVSQKKKKNCRSLKENWESSKILPTDSGIL